MFFDINNIIKNISETLKHDYSEVSYKTWLIFFENAYLDDCSNIIIHIPNTFVKTVIEARYLNKIEEYYRSQMKLSW